MITIAVDAMGGDNAPTAIIEGILLFLLKMKGKNVKLLIFGNKTKIELLSRNNKLFNRYCEIIDTKEAKIDSNSSVLDALRTGRESSMWKAVESVKNKEADAVISAGSTGALMAISKKLLGMLEGISIDRPSIVGVIPSKKKPIVILDLGANATCTAEVLAQFAVMGDAFAKAILDNVDPKVALLNIGSEDIKGNQVVQEAAKILSNYKENNILNYVGFVEGNQIFDGDVNVIVTDGFSGNVALKVLEGTTRFVVWNFKKAIKRSIVSKLGLFFLLPSLLKLKKKADTRRYNGAMMIGLNGITLKAHGSSDKVSMFFSLNAAYKVVKGNINDKILKELKQIV